ncbi:MAG TPA: oligosaccharide flippase family protein [Terriglobales bacterium]|nr:oligosaccharide flippase family protein [Terriglobales bacterium]
MSISKSLLRYGGFVLSVSTARVVGTLLTAATFPFLVRRLGVDVYGLWSYVVAVCGFTALVANPGLTSYAAQRVAARREAAFGDVSDVLVLRVLASVLAAAAVLLVARFEVRPDVRLLLQWYGVASVLIASLSLDYLLPSLELFHAQSFISITQQSLYAAGIFTLVRSPKDVIWLPVSILGSSLLTSVVVWILLWRAGYRFRFSIAPSRWAVILVPSLHYAGSSLMSNLYHRSGTIAVRFYLGEHALGLYAAVARLADVLRNFLSVPQSVLMPRMALRSNSADGLARLARFAASILIWFGIPLTIGSIVTAPVVVPWLLGAQFQEAVRAFQWVALYVLTAPAAVLFAGTILYATGRHRAYFVSTLCGAITAVVLSLILPPLFGISGACLAYVLGEVGVALCAFLLCPPEVRAAVKTPLFGVAVIASLLMAAAIRLAMPWHFPPLVLIGLGCLVYAVSWAGLGRNLLRREVESFV